MTPKFIFTIITLLLVTLSLIEACRFGSFFSCVPDQWGCSDRGGKCMVQGRNCQCVPPSQYYGQGYMSPPVGGGYHGGNNNGYYREPEVLQGPGGMEAGAFSEGAIERQTNMMLQMTRMYNYLNR